jgi:uncharacterized protein (TIGR03435 family)
MKTLPFFAVVLLCAQALPGQAPAPNEPQRFDVASIRRNIAGKQQDFGPTASGYRVINLTLLVPLMFAYPPSTGQAIYQMDQIKDLPDWVVAERYDIDARIDPAQLAAWQAPGAQQRLLPQLLQNLLADRCKLQTHKEQKEMASFSLQLAKNGPKFQESVPGAQHPAGMTVPGGGVVVPEEQGRVLHFYGVQLSVLAAMLSQENGRPVVDKTGLKGKYDIVFEKREARENDGLSSSITFESVSKLGLKLVAEKDVIDVLVIDHIERPSEN